MLNMFIDYSVDVIDMVTIGIILFGFGYAMYLLVGYHTKQRFGFPKRRISLHRIRVVLGEYLLLALELFICSDVIMSVKDPTYEHLMQLGIVIVIRIVVAYFLQKELEHLEGKEDDF